MANKTDGITQYLLVPVYAAVWWGMLKRLREPAPKYPALRTQEHVTFRDLSGRNRRATIATQPQRSWFWILGFLVCTSTVLIPAHLVEFRYFIVPSLILQLYMLSAHTVITRHQRNDIVRTKGAVPIGSLLFTLMLHIVVNVATVHVFLWHGFVATDGSFSRFMW